MKIFANSSLKFFDYYEKIKPNLVIILGDRYEMLAATTPTTTLNIPVAHIHGEVKEPKVPSMIVLEI